jgi:hypothetical protein
MTARQRRAVAAARLAGQPALEPAVLEDLLTRYRALTGAGLAANLYRRTATAKDARRLARRFRTFEDLILRFATRLDLDSGSWLASVVRDRAVTGRSCRARGMVELTGHRVQEAADHRRGTAARDHLIQAGGSSPRRRPVCPRQGEGRGLVPGRDQHQVGDEGREQLTVRADGVPLERDVRAVI